MRLKHTSIWRLSTHLTSICFFSFDRLICCFVLVTLSPPTNRGPTDFLTGIPTRDKPQDCVCAFELLLNVFVNVFTDVDAALSIFFEVFRVIYSPDEKVGTLCI